MSPSDAFDPVRSALERAGIRYAVGGSWASAAFGEPRFTNDIDILAELTAQNLGPLLRYLPDTFYVDPAEALTAVCAGRPLVVRVPLGSEELDRAVAIASPVCHRRRHPARETALVQVGR
jgi:hypothetical protein